MDATLNIFTKILAFQDTPVNSNPRLRTVDWDRECGGIPVKDPESTGHQIAIGGSKLIFDGSRATTIDGTTAFSLDLLATNASTYRITHTGGTAPGFRTSRALTLNGCAVTFTVQPNNLVALNVAGPSDFTSVQVGDYLFIPHTTTGDAANVINVLNAGYWQVLVKTNATNLVITRPTGITFEGVSEIVTLTSNSQMRGFNATGVQVGDTVAISAGFSQATRKTFLVTAVTDLFVEFVSTLPLPNESGILPTATGMRFYTDNKRIVYIECDQEAVIRVNGDTGDFQSVSPIEPGNPNKPALYLKTGSIYTITIVNKSTSLLNALVVSFE